MSVTKCLWCGRAFTPRATGGKRQRFCRPACRRALDAAGRRYIEVALVAGTLTIPELRNASRTTRALGGMRKIPPKPIGRYPSPQTRFTRGKEIMLPAGGSRDPVLSDLPAHAGGSERRSSHTSLRAIRRASGRVLMPPTIRAGFFAIAAERGDAPAT
jgi:hypothetical protein